MRILELLKSSKSCTEHIPWIHMIPLYFYLRFYSTIWTIFFIFNKEIAYLTEINLPVPLNNPFEGLHDYDRDRYF